ncbi:serine hydrolase domain-containing protein [Patulibacter sp. NPDC049589]|uniref:serine hydrolase domain-containing protein n=1 Tax=Patulibacter sp. NPDC049589 TaxID=3154731 RepID=UPI003428B923
MWTRLTSGAGRLARWPLPIVVACALVAPSAATAAERCAPGQFDRGGTCTSFRAAARRAVEITRSVMGTEGGRAAIVRVDIGGRTLVDRGFGQSMEGVPASRDMHFRPGAMVIPMLSTLLLQLQDARRLDLDDRLSRWFPSFPNADRVTLRQLASSTSGYPDYLQGNLPFQTALHADVFRHWTDDELLEYAFDRPLVCAPGACFHYAHTNFIVLGRVVEQVTGRSVASLIRSRFLGPLRLTHTRISKLPGIPAPALHAYTTDRGVYEDATTWSPSWGIGEGMVMTSTAGDMIRMIRAIGSGRLFSKAAARQLTTPLSRGLPGSPASIEYGLGIDVANGWMLQNPQFNGYVGILAYLAQRRIAIVVENTNGPDVADGQAISGTITKRLTQYLTPDRPIAK